MPLSPSAPVPAMSYAWIALDKDNMILEYSYNSFSTLLLKEDNHLIWISLRQLIMKNNLLISFKKVSAHADDSLNNQEISQEITDDQIKYSKTSSTSNSSLPFVSSPILGTSLVIVDSGS
ncbi:hypothetical protein RhiirC2_793776 [Rhizophagus irregularis]|uniref:RNase H type-1 domain-containing protein n=1 Tax=Rhizophagus irregularis TaxID=588596 RepID=A0A2N1MES9_9GLOM|nr:hypothetical protein RhiirC2_793776 [Rhizophagus irregularis]